MHEDNVLDSLDIQPFVDAISLPGTLPPELVGLADITLDGNADGIDIQPFIDLITSGPAYLTSIADLALLADFDSNYAIDDDDLDLFLGYYMDPVEDLRADLDKDGNVDSVDLAIFSLYYNLEIDLSVVL